MESIDCVHKVRSFASGFGTEKFWVHSGISSRAEGDKPTLLESSSAHIHSIFFEA